ncbi:DUF1127 domain-containing protein [Loktanella sp. D2R18]|uniref:DUF1127 domain-containing protein n=1 Tax=Rhodobacterales TaxID=204455 RepID=UPI000DEB2D98|nr:MULTISPECIES: DUF1127 domain-containing protein [Rhodobacterales]MDO6590250.1 DUF1127 domain-containing protein [Yoonia sp. 1_MG-2023]RBW42938.1 DUF1127 domain-containing protein [Loktanella sp. D2R18]
MAYQVQTQFAGASFGARFNAFRSEIAQKIAAHKVYTSTVNELQSLSNRDLADLGVSRSDIKRIALEAAYGN